MGGKAEATVLSSGADKSVAITALPEETRTAGNSSAVLYSPRKPSKCPLFCAFYAEFDNKVGPRICFSSPEDFMDIDIDTSIDVVQNRLQHAFDKITSKGAHSTGEADAHREQDDENNGLQPRSKVDIQSNENDDHSEDGVDVHHSTNSIFDSCSEYIITANELTGQIINLSTHNIHMLTRPTMISDERYERNALLFCVGFVLRRTEDPRPFRPVLSKLALTFRDMEVESQFLSSPTTRPRIQGLLERLLTSLNSSRYESNIIATKTNALNLKLFYPPRSRAHHVADHEVPLLLRRDWQKQGHEWDLTINWVSLFIDGITNVVGISSKAEVDLEMVRACLRVLKYHGVIKMVDMFFFSNRYESTRKAASLLSGQNPKLLEEAVEYVVKQSSYVGADNSPSLASRNEFGSYRSKDHSMTLKSRPDHLEIKEAVAELFSVLRRKQSIQNVWTMLLARENAPIDWLKIYDMIDHRRFVAFGQINGLLRRIHLFPMRISPVETPEIKTERDRVLSLMDGKTCDDAICCILKCSIGEALSFLLPNDVVKNYW